jgi:hypothetical protein
LFVVIVNNDEDKSKTTTTTTNNSNSNNNNSGQQQRQQQQQPQPPHSLGGGCVWWETRSLPLIATEQKQRTTIQRWMSSGISGFHIRGSLRMQDTEREGEVPVLCQYEELAVSSSALLALFAQTMETTRTATRRQAIKAMFAGLQRAILKDSIHEEAEFLVHGTDGQGQARPGALPLFMAADGQTVMTDIEVLSICFPEKKI